VDEYISSQPEVAQGVLKQVRDAIRKAVPRAEEMIAYQMPGYKLHGRPVLYFAGWKKHYSLYPVTRLVAAEFKDELAAYEVRNSTLRLQFSAPVPVKLIGRIAKFRAKEEAERA
jgi:uncharacterized protein YdhG (YjbR/CyaY superfamily)